MIAYNPVITTLPGTDFREIIFVVIFRRLFQSRKFKAWL